MNLTDDDEPVLCLNEMKNGFLASSQDKRIKIWDNFYKSFETKAQSKAVTGIKCFVNGSLISVSEVYFVAKKF